MTYYKIIQNELIVGVGCAFLKWNVTKHDFRICDVNQGQFVQSIVDSTIYRDNWLKAFPQEATGFEMAKVVVINQEEFEELQEFLISGETVEEPEPVEEEEVIPEAPPEQHVLTIAEMRELILSQQEEINNLKQALSH